jgi:hypothetical protein
MPGWKATGRVRDVAGGNGNAHLQGMRTLLKVSALMLVASCFAGCAMLESPATDPLVTIEARGGLCPQAPCGETTVIERDGTIHLLGSQTDGRGPASQAAMTALEAAILTTDFAAIKAKRFTGDCPVNFGGQEFIYEFATPSGPQRIASCEAEIDPAHPLFASLRAAFTGAH